VPKPKQDLEKVTIRIFAGDREALEDLYPNADYNKVIRTLVRKHIRLLQEQANKLGSMAADSLPEINLED
jgi:hypothetical protein